MASEDKNNNKQPNPVRFSLSQPYELRSTWLSLSRGSTHRELKQPFTELDILRSMEIATVVDSFQNISDGDAVLE